MVQWLRLPASTAGATGSIPGWGTKISNALAKRKKIEGKKIYFKEMSKKKTTDLKKWVKDMNRPFREEEI